MSNVAFSYGILVYAFSCDNTSNARQVYTEKHSLKILVKC